MACALAAILAARGYDLAFNLLEIGALPIPGEREPFHALLDTFPATRVSALEIDPQLCAELNRTAAPGMHFYPCALGHTEESRHLYETADRMCTSLYPPDERYADLFHNLEVMRLKRIAEVETMSLERFVQEHRLGVIDFVKLDVQGAELEILQGGVDVVRGLLAVVCEVEFVPLYRGQPLFGDVDAFLRRHGASFHKFLGMAGRVMKPLTAHGSPNYPVQFLWSDAMFVRDLFALDSLDGDQLLKLAVLCDLYDSKDVALHVLRLHDTVHNSALADEYLGNLQASGPWQPVAAQT